MPLVNPGLAESQSWSKYLETTFFRFLHQTQATRIFSTTLTMFDLRLTPEGAQNP